MNFVIFGGFQKNKYLLGYEEFVDIFLGDHKIGLYLGVISMHFMVLLKVKVQNGGYFFCVGRKLNILECLKFLIFFFFGGGGGGGGEQ